MHVTGPCGDLAGLAALTDRRDQIPLPHLRASGNVSVLRDLVVLLAIAVLERTTGRAAALTSSRRLFAELATRALRELGDGAFAGRRPLCLLDVLFRGLHLA